MTVTRKVALLVLHLILGTGFACAATLRVPQSFPTIQSAVNRANPGDTIQIARGIYVEQVSIEKNLVLQGAGKDATIIRAPAVLVPGPLGVSSIVEIRAGASVAMSRLAVSGPGAGTCEAGALKAGIRAYDGAHLDLSFAAVTHIQDTPMKACFHSGDAILIGDPTSTGTASIQHSWIKRYQGSGIVVLSEGSTAVISHNVITGAGRSSVVANYGIDFALGATGTVSHNIISGNACGAPDLCGTDFFNEFQVAGFVGGAPGTVITHNLFFGNQVGIYAFDGVKLSHNVLLDSEYFGLALQDGTLTSEHDVITGGFGGVAIIAAFADTTATLAKVNIMHTSGTPIQRFECCGFTAAVIGR
jgi:nitrous oxidase accessory protein NosD